MTLMYGAIYTILQSSITIRRRRLYLVTLGLSSLALGVKLNALLFFPAFALIFVVEQGWRVSMILNSIMVLLGIQMVLGWPFLTAAPYSYISMAFNFGRQFEYDQSMNWYMFSRETFEYLQTSTLLPALTVVSLLAMAHYRWLSPPSSMGMASKKILDGPHGLLAILPSYPRQPCSWTLRKKLQVILECNLIGILFARSLHYQFSLWFLQLVPVLLFGTEGRRWYQTGGHRMRGWSKYIAIIIWLAIEGTWNWAKHGARSATVSTIIITGLLMLLLS